MLYLHTSIIMIALLTSTKAKEILANNLKEMRLKKGLTQKGLSQRSGVSLASLRKFEQKGMISLESFIKLAITLDCIDDLIQATKVSEQNFKSIDEVLHTKTAKKPQRGWRE